MPRHGPCSSTGAHLPGCMIGVVVVASLLAAHTANSAAFGLAPAGSTHHRVHHPVKVCQDVLGELRQDQRITLRDAVQTLQLHQRRLKELDDGIWAKTEYSLRDHKLTDWFEFLTQNGLNSSLASLRTHVEKLEANLTAEVELLKSSKAMPSHARLQTIKACSIGHLNRHLAHDRPKFSYMLEYFKRPWVIEPMVTRLKSSCKAAKMACELVANVDNPHEHEKWMEAVQTHSELSFIDHAFTVTAVFSDNVHESRAYNRAARLARGDYVVVMQDDQLPPRTRDWPAEADAFFTRYPYLGSIGSQSYRFCRDNDNNRYQGNFPFRTDDGQLFHFAMVVDFAPMAFRHQAWESVGGLDETASEKGNCGITGDWEIATRLWLDGWQVAYMRRDGQEGDGQPGGTHTPWTGERCWGRQMHVGGYLYERRFDDHVRSELCQHVRRINLMQLKLQAAECPYQGLGGCALEGGAAAAAG